MLNWREYQAFEARFQALLRSEWLAEAFEKFDTVSEAADGLGIDRGSLSRICDAHGVRFSGRPGPRETVTKDILLDADSRGLTTFELAEELGVTVMAIRAAVTKHGVRLRTAPPTPTEPKPVSLDSLTDIQKARFKALTQEFKKTPKEALHILLQAEMMKPDA